MEEVLVKKERKFITINRIEQINQENNVVSIIFKGGEVKVIFYRPDMVRIWMEPVNGLNNTISDAIIEEQDFEAPEIKVSDEDSYYKIQSEKCVIRAYKDPLLFAMYDFRDKTVIWEEEIPLQYSDEASRQSLKTKEEEYFYGCGVQNGYFSHKGNKVNIENLITHWNDGAVSNPVPFYMSTAGYGAFRNTFKPGVYEFTRTAVMTHNEKRFDCYYFYGPSFKKIVMGYTELTGRPALIPRWGFGLGDADCYNTNNTTYTGTHHKINKQTTLEALNIAKAYRDNDMPGSWILPNDGYGCGYSDLDVLVKEAWSRYGFRIGLWTENGVEKISHEVGTLGSRLCKLDVAWVGPGYEFAFNAAKTAYEGIENNSKTSDDKGNYSERGYVWSVCGWAGTQRYSAVWTGDQSGNWEYIRFHIPTYIGAGLSGMPYIGSDIDGIFGGSAKTHVRDLQWKAFTPILINMSGWAEKDKQPWVWGEPYTSINRKYLKLRQRLTPYIYSYANEAYETGAPIVRAMLWEFPKDEYAKTKNTQYQFMLGNWFLVAPVYEDKEVRDEIYLPQGKWIDYWSGEQYEGGKIINNYKAPLETLPLLIRSGAIIPMYPEALYDGQVITDELHPLTLEVYPSGTTNFELYEDDGHTSLHRQGYYSKMLIISTEADGKASVIVNSAIGSYEGMPFARKYEFIIHTTIDPEKINFLCGEAEGELIRAESMLDWQSNKCCSWYFNKNEKKGLLYIKTKAVPLHSKFEIFLDKFSSDIFVERKDNFKVPDIPQNLKVALAEDTSLKLHWEPVCDADYYEIKADDIIYSYINHEFVHKNLSFASIHKYQIRAVNSKGKGNWSEEAIGITLQDKMKDSIPLNELTAYATSCIGGSYISSKVVDGGKATQWISNYNYDGLPQMITVDIEKIYEINKVTYQPREQNSRAVITKYNFYISEDGRRFKKLINEGVWEDDGKPKTIEIEQQKAKSIRIEALECSTPEYPGASAVAVNIFKVSGTKGQIAADFTGDGKVDMADLNFALQYYGSREGDNDWGYVSKADVDRDGIIGIYDVAYTASFIKPANKPRYENRASGLLKLGYDKCEATEGEEVIVNVIGENIVDVYAFESIIKIDKERYELIGIEASQALKEMISACKEKDGCIFISYTYTGDFEGISGSGVLVKIKLRAKTNGTINFLQERATIIGSNLDMVNALSKELTKCQESIFETQIPNLRLAASATSEQAEEGDGSAESVFDGNLDTCWHTPWDKSSLLPQSIIIDLGGISEVSKIKCTLRPIGANGVISSYTVYAIDNCNCETIIAEDIWEDDGKEKYVAFKHTSKAEKIRIQANEGKGGFASVVSIKVYELIRTKA